MYIVVAGRRYVIARESHMHSMRLLFSGVTFISVPDGLVDIVLVVYRQEGAPSFSMTAAEKILSRRRRDQVLLAALIASNELQWEERQAARHAVAA